MVEVDCFGNQHAQSKKKNEKESRERERERVRERKWDGAVIVESG